ncbi:outer membrane protein assembly factor BamB family protein [Nonomuraea wenchangensis]|uniref:Outer membrane protein assembly factor BamB, contains PQQ-like beta-propeller repeat n=1 Tax=Nonomuraea wenchangensis TaxID=568860 RepID=A0A1I0L698_9ACTN|nr:PQQ-binding-like beta-propeller repeat protein [Nonomuraea wenchangensis]SEU35176.1 Outer membrane protein assembly factor BamB, contains PQQ-like beta-propeller repeat [Nonomuraea wenchangensis]
MLRAAAVLAALLLLGTAADAATDTLAPVRWRLAWTAPADGELWNWDLNVPLHGASTQALAMATADNTVRVHEARTGRLAHTLSGFAAPIAGTWVAAGTVVVLTADSQGGDQRLQAYDADTGTLLWRRQVTLSRQDVKAGAGRYQGPPVMVTERGLVLPERESEPFAFVSLNLHKGTVAARTVHEWRCDMTAAAATRSILLLDHCADGRVRLSAADPATLRTGWTRTLPSPGPRVSDARPPWFGITISGDGYAQVTSGDTTTFYAPDGRRLSSAEEALRPGRGGRWSEPMFIGGVPEIDHDGALRASPAKWPLPAFLTSLDTVTGRLRALPISAPSTGTVLVGTAPGLAFVRLDAGSVVAYTLGYGVPDGRELLSGVSADAWPDACDLLPRPAEGGYITRPATQALFGRKLPKPVQCDRIPPTDDEPVVSLSVEWVSADARRLYAVETAPIKREWFHDPVTEDPYVLDYLRPTATGTGSAPEAVVNVGPVIVRLTSSSRQTLRALTPQVRDKLLARYHLPRRAPAALPQVRWSFPADASVNTDPVVRGGIVYTADGSQVYAVDASSGRLRWSRALGGYLGRTLVVAGGLVYVADGANLYALDARTGRPRWQRRAKRLLDFTVAEGHVFYGSWSRTVALDAASGRELWRSSHTDAPVAAGGLVYVAGYALDAATGHPRWHVETGDDTVAAPAGKVVYMGGAGERLHALDTATGKERWNVPLGAAPVTAPLHVGDAVYVRGTDGVLHALDARTGRQRWIFPTGVRHAGTTLAADRRRVYVEAADGAIHALDATSGTVLWRTPTGAALRSGLALHAGTVYAGTVDGTLHALDAATGADRPLVSGGGTYVTASVPADGLIYTGVGGNLYALRPR